MAGAVNVRSGEFTVFHSRHQNPEKRISVDALLASAAIVEAVAAAISDLQLPLVVVDPVMVAKSGDRLIDPAAQAAYVANPAGRERPETNESLAALEKAMEANDPSVPPSMLYAYAAIMEGVPFANGAPNLSCDVPAIEGLAREKHIPIGGKDFKTGQTMLKTVLSPMFKARMLGVAGWYSTNILGNRDGEVLDDPESFKTKEESKLGVLEHTLQPKLYPDLYGNIFHKVRINYYPPRGDNKEGWDNIDIFGWLGYPMQIKVDFLCRDSILAAPIVLDLALFSDLAKRAGMSGIQEWISFYFKSPMVAEGLYPEHDLFIQLTKLKNTLRYLKGEEQITHLGIEYYENS